MRRASQSADCVPQFANETVTRTLKPVGVQFLSMGSPPWSADEDSKRIADMADLPAHQMLPLMLEMLQGCYHCSPST
jgi:hypothetical protein